MNTRQILLLFVAPLFASAAMSQSTETIASESRDAASAFVGTTNFLVGRLGRDCLSLLGRTETAKEFVARWQQRNAKYFSASVKYMGKRLDEAESTGGATKRDAVLREYTIAVRSNGEVSAQRWLQSGTREESCKRAIAIIETGGMDISSQMPMFDELNALVSWAEK